MIYSKMQEESRRELAKIPANTIEGHASTYGIENAEPLLYALDGMLRYAKAHKKRYESQLAEDYALGPQFLEVIKGLRWLLNGDGAVALEAGITTDSKSNGACEAIFWHAMKAAGFTEDDI